MLSHDLTLIIVSAVSEILGTISGFGSSTFFLPIASIFESIKFVLVLTSLLHCFANIFKIYLFRQHLTFSLFLKFAIPSVIASGIGALINPRLSTHVIEIALGIFLVILSCISLIKGYRNLKIPQPFAVPLSFASGFLTGVIGTGGAIRGLALATLNIPKNNFVALSAAIDLGGDALRAGIYIKNGYMDWNQWFYIPLLAIAGYIGTKIGKKILDRINQAQFEKIVSVFIFISGLIMIFKK